MARSKRVLGALIGMPVDLPGEFAARWPELRVLRLRLGGAPTWIPSWFFGSTRVAITLWHYVFLGRGVQLTEELLLHELRHVQQFQTVRAFPVRYLWELAWRGYEGNRFEADARAYAAALLRDTPSH